MSDQGGNSGRGRAPPQWAAGRCAWTEAYGELADIMIRAEAALADHVSSRPGGWRGWRTFVNESDIARITPPFGAVCVDMQATTPVALVSGGVGLTPLVSMLKAVLKNTGREVVFVHGARTSKVHAMKDRLKAAADTKPRLTSIVFYDAPLASDIPGYDHGQVGMVDLRRIAGAVLKPQADHYICGPIPFMRMQVETLKALGVPEARIHYEVFGTDVFDA